ncbi:Multidrug/Oligosaccharidyl-lipid/Polysaccharide (MOP) Flippase Superfamily [Achlya hypogyna]|uniref:Multidrug/Oligosaccharidyl-lipid/Polysaccharide (MOP) Flippase Superfamily n=1 Tax=Achlya hypogyna TaxID=1202772 RepID=A0A1V9YD19_ACHHY|nr:Multidrug/Oligosaccharidyl-lipid/Polysaccharide (MOP) Flippase Superfamily [Achlya hypogyna]
MGRLAYYFALYQDMGLRGVWVGYAVATTAKLGFLAIKFVAPHEKHVNFATIDWNKVVADARSRPLLAKPTDVFVLKSELGPYVSLALQMALANVARIALISIDSAFLGHLGTDALAGSSLSTIWTQVPLNCVWAMASALITLCGQAYGAKNYNLMGIWFQMALLLVSVLMVPVFVWYWTLDVVLSRATDDENIIALGLRFARLLSFSIWPSLVYVCMRQYLQAMNLVAPTTIIGTMAIVIAVFANWLLIYGAGDWNGLGFDGSALATVVASWFQPVALYLYAFAYRGYHKQAWGGWSWSAFTKDRWMTFLRMALPLGLNDGFTTLANSCMSLIAAKLGAEILASNAILLTLWGMVWALFWGIACSTQVKVANHLGAGHPKAAKAASQLGFCAIVVTAAIVAGVTYLAHTPILEIYTSDMKLIAHCVDVLPLFVLGFALDALEITITAVLEGMGQMPFVSMVAFVGMWCIQLPAAYLFAIYWGYGFAGLWYGICLTAGFKLAVLAVKYVTINWTQMALDAMETVEAADEWSLQPTCAIASPANALLTSPGFHRAPANKSEAKEGQPLLAKRTDVFDLKAEIVPYLSLATQMALANIARIALTSIDSAFLGHLGTDALAASSLATIWTQVPLFAVWAMASALVTLCGQAYGARNFTLMGVWFQMSLILVTLLTIPVFIWYWVLDVVLARATDDVGIVVLGMRFARFLSFSIWPTLAYACMRQYLQAMNIVAPTTIIGVVAIFLAIGANSMLIYGTGGWSGLGFDGSALATVVASWFQPVALFWYAFSYRSYHKQAWGGWQISAYTKDRWVTFLRMAVPLGLNDGLTTLANSCMSLIAARLGAEVLASNAILLTLWGMVWALFWGIGCSTQVKVANHLGAGHPKAAKAASRLGFATIAAAVAMVALSTLAGQDLVLRVYTNDVVLIAQCIDVLPLFVLAFCLDALEITMTAVLDGMGQMPFVSMVAFVAMWGIQLPAAYLFAISWGHGFAGLWYGICLTAGFKLIVLMFKYMSVDWAQMAWEAMEAMEAPEAADWAVQPCAVASPANVLFTPSQGWSQTHQHSSEA